ncbi:MAG: glycosyltransferase family 2 protein [wastewater metagenome]|nr:glycosyltransferase family 2 protein [Candidatus Loosdrechtia aerotolerans]
MYRKYILFRMEFSVKLNKNPLVSVIIPSYNCSQFLPQCLNAIKSSDYSPYEIIVVDDASTDDSPKIACGAGVNVIHMDKQSGPGAARNAGAQHANGEIYFFVDSDVVINKNSIRCMVSKFTEHPEVGAMFGSYDKQPSAPNFLSQYKNLFHHFIHQTSYNEANIFWAGCGAVRKEVFREVGGFNTVQYTKPSIEDVELGLRISRISKQGYRILLIKELQVKHLKRWGVYSLLYTDIFCRAIPWTNLILTSQKMPKGLNLKKSL